MRLCLEEAALGVNIASEWNAMVLAHAGVADEAGGNDDRDHAKLRPNWADRHYRVVLRIDGGRPNLSWARNFYAPEDAIRAPIGFRYDVRRSSDRRRIRR